MKSVLALAAALPAAAAAPVLAQGGGCAPPGQRVPSLTVRPAGPGPGLRFEGGAALADGQAVLLALDPDAPPLPRGLCVAGLHGRVAAAATLDAGGAHEWPLPARLGLDLPPLAVAAWAPGSGWGQASLSNWLKLPPLPSAGAGNGSPPAIVISEFMKDPAAVGDTKGEWIELYNAGASPVDLEGWVLSDHGSDSTLLANGGNGIVVAPGGFVVLAREADPALNGGVTADATYAGMTLSNGDDEIVLSMPNGTVVDEIAYDDGIAWPDEGGRSVALDPGLMDAVANDDGASWCHSTSVLSGGDTGTPGAPNDPCGG